MRSPDVPGLDLPGPPAVRSRASAGFRGLVLGGAALGGLNRAVTNGQVESALSTALTLVLDHLGKPPAGRSAWSRWAEQLAAAAAEPNVLAKISGLGTGRPGAPAPVSWAPSVDHALAVFGARRLMVGSDWPISTIAGDYSSMWQQALACLAGLGETDREHILWRTAARVYHCSVSMTAKDGS